MYLWIIAARPKTLVAVICPILVAVTLAYPNVNIYKLSLIFTFGLSIQILTNFVNDLFDFLKGADNGERLGPTRVTQSGLISIKQIKRAILLVLLTTLVSGGLLIQIAGVELLPVIAFSIIFAFLYTAGPYPIAYIGLGEIFVLFFFGPIVTASSYYILTNNISFEAILIGFGLGAISTAILIANNLRDYQTDMLANKRTSIVKFGKTFGVVEYLLALFIAFIVPICFSFESPTHFYVFFTSLFIILALPTIRNVIRDHEIEKALEATAKLLVVYSLIFIITYLA